MFSQEDKRSGEIGERAALCPLIAVGYLIRETNKGSGGWSGLMAAAMRLALIGHAVGNTIVRWEKFDVKHTLGYWDREQGLVNP